jgi:uncharacterized membrane protein YkgB
LNRRQQNEAKPNHPMPIAMEHQLLMCCGYLIKGCHATLPGHKQRGWDCLPHNLFFCREGKPMSFVIKILVKFGILKEDLDYHFIRASMVIIYFFFGYQKWFDYEAQGLIPFFTHGPLIFWMYPVFGVKGASYFLGVSEWLFGALLFAGFWNKKLGILGALGSVATFITTITIIPFMPDGWAASAGGFPAMVGNVAFLMKDVVLLAASVYLLRQDVLRVLQAAKESSPALTAQLQRT